MPKGRSVVSRKTFGEPPTVFRLKSYDLHISPFGEWDKDREHMVGQLA
jgi:hypothetical protein